MEFLDFMLRGNYKKFYQSLKAIGEKNGKKPSLMFVDAAVSSILYGSGLSDYLNYKFYERTLKERKKYVTIKYASKFYAKYSPKEAATNLRIKPKFHENYSKYTKRDYFLHEHGIEKLKEFINKHPEFIVKPVDGLGGTGVRKVSLNDFKTIEELYDKIEKDRLFLEEIVVQNEEWGKLCPKSVNTIRAMTRIMNGKAELFYAAARIGNGKVIMDNFHQGGVGVSIDISKGILIGNAVSKDLEEMEVHSVTKEKFDGFKIPYWQEIQKMVCEAAEINKDVRVVGWDVAIAKDGPLLIEANRRPGFDLVQVLLKHGAKYMLEDIKNTK